MVKSKKSIKKASVSGTRGFWKRVLALEPNQRKVIVLVALVLSAIPCLLILSHNFKRHSVTMGRDPMFRTSTAINWTTELDGSTQGLNQTQEQIDQQMQLLEQLDGQEFSTSELESYLQNTTVEEFFSTSTFGTSSP